MIRIYSDICDWYIRLGCLHVIVWKPGETPKWRFGLHDGDGARALVLPWLTAYLGKWTT